MRPGRIKGFTAIYAIDQAEFLPLHIRRDVINGDVRLSAAWYPTPAELELLNAGGPIIVDIMSPTLPPSYVTVGTLDDADMDYLPPSIDMANGINNDHWCLKRELWIYLDGVRVPECVAYSRPNGFVRVYARDDKGELIDALEGELQTTVLRGKVEVSLFPLKGDWHAAA